jgi:hypothetical protein
MNEHKLMEQFHSILNYSPILVGKLLIKFISHLQYLRKSLSETLIKSREIIL